MGITFINYWYGIVPKEEVTCSFHKLGNAVFGQNILYYLLQFATALILAVAANTGFSAFPVLAYNLAKDKFMPHMYMDRGDRLGYSNGILTLAAGSIVLLLIFPRFHRTFNPIVFNWCVYSVCFVSIGDGCKMAKRN